MKTKMNLDVVAENEEERKIEKFINMLKDVMYLNIGQELKIQLQQLEHIELTKRT